jgi:hypothetical protein
MGGRKDGMGCVKILVVFLFLFKLALGGYLHLGPLFFAVAEGDWV